jgi:CubicO group peptidase (beta-lactamase class C family)
VTTADPLDEALTAIDGWGTPNVAAAVVRSTGVLASRGDRTRPFHWASVTKLVTSWAVLIATERHLLDLDEPAGPPGATVRHLLAHASGLAFDGDAILASPGTRRIYSNPGFDLLGELVADRSGKPFGSQLAEWVLEPLGMTGASLEGAPSQGLHGSLDDLIAFAGELLRPTLVSRAVADLAATVAFPGLAGVVPGVGRFDPCDWGLGLELHDGKAPHWMGSRNSPDAFGHFGGAGTFLWLEPTADLALGVLTDREFGPWALNAWPALSDAVLVALGHQGEPHA